MKPERKHSSPWLTLGLYLSLTALPQGTQANAASPVPRLDSGQLGGNNAVSSCLPPACKGEKQAAAAEKKKNAGNRLASASVSSPRDREKGSAASSVKKNPSTGDLFGTRGGYLHPFFGIREEYTDNVYNIEVDKVENFLTTVSTGIWLSVPRLREVPLTIVPHNTAVGGIRYSMPGSGSFERFQSYLLGSLDNNTFSADSDLDYTAWRFEGMYQQNLPVGISFRVMDRYSRDRDRFDMGSFQRGDFTMDSGNISVGASPSLIRDYVTNQALVSTSFAANERFSAMLNFSNFFLDYEDADDRWLDRTDNTLGLTLSYAYSPKTSFFIEYERAEVTYAEGAAKDSKNSFFYGGINWLGSAKISLMAKGGYHWKQYDGEDTSEDLGTFATEAQLNYLITDKSKVHLSLYRALEETDSLQRRGKTTTAARLRYDQHFTYRLQGGVELEYELNDYDGFGPPRTAFPEEEARKDSRYLVRPAIRYFFRDWLVAELSYAFEDRNSSDDFYDFATQTFFLGVHVAF